MTNEEYLKSIKTKRICSMRYKSASYAGSFDDWQDARDARAYREAEKRAKEQAALEAWLDREDYR